MTYSSQREVETLNQCSNILEALRQLEAAIANGPRFTVREEDEQKEFMAKTRAIYKDIDKHCRHNLHK